MKNSNNDHFNGMTFEDYPAETLLVHILHKLETRESNELHKPC